MLSRSTKRMLLAGLLLATRAQFGSAQGNPGAYLPPNGSAPTIGAPQPVSSYPLISVQPYSAPNSTVVQVSQPAPGTPQPLPGPKAPEPKIDVPQPNVDAQTFQPLTSAALGDSQVALSAPQIMGDFGGYSVRKTIFVPTTQTTMTTVLDTTMGTTISSTNTSKVLVPVSVVVPVPGRFGSGFKVADDESPIPTDRVFFTWNGFNGLSGGSGFTGPQSSTTVVTVPVPFDEFVITTVKTSGAVAVDVGSANLNREIFGFEKTFLNGNASIEVRIPIYQATGQSFDLGGFAGDNFGDVTTVFKYALVNERDRVFSLGLATTFPSGQAIVTDDGNVRAVLFQPFVGFYRGYGDFFIQGFTSLVASTSSQDPTVLFNDYAVGVRLYSDPTGRFVRSVSPALEVHVTTPLDSRGDDDSGLFISDILSFTGAVHFGIGANSTLSVGCNIPVTGPRPYNSEAIVQLNYHF